MLLVGGLEHQFYIFPYIGNNIIPTDSYFSEGVETTNQVSKMYLSILSRIIIKCGCWFGVSSIMSDVAKHGTARLHRPKWKRRRRVGIGLGKWLWEAKSNCVHRSSQNFWLFPDLLTRHMTCRISLANWNHYFSDSLVILHEWLPGIGNWMILPAFSGWNPAGEAVPRRISKRFFGAFGHPFCPQNRRKLDRKNGITQNARKSAAPRLHRRSQIWPQRGMSGCHGWWHQACEAISDPIEMRSK